MSRVHLLCDENMKQETQALGEFKNLLSFIRMRAICMLRITLQEEHSVLTYLDSFIMFVCENFFKEQ